MILKTLEVLSWDPALARQPSVWIKPIDISNHLCISHVQASVFWHWASSSLPFLGILDFGNSKFFEVYLFFHPGTTTAVETEYEQAGGPRLGLDTSLPCTIRKRHSGFSSSYSLLAFLKCLLKAAGFGCVPERCLHLVREYPTHQSLLLVSVLNSLWRSLSNKCSLLFCGHRICLYFPAWNKKYKLSKGSRVVRPEEEKSTN